MLCLTGQQPNEQNFSHFNLQRSIDGIHFITIEKLNARGNATLKTDYQYLDKNIVALGSNKIYYRLEQVDKDGKAALSKIVLLELINNSITIFVRPNPVHSTVEVNINNTQQNQPVQLIISNAQGRAILSENRIINSGSNVISYNSSN